MLSRLGVGVMPLPTLYRYGHCNFFLLDCTGRIDKVYCTVVVMEIELKSLVDKAYTIEEISTIIN